MREADPYGHCPAGQGCLSQAAGNSVSQVAERLSDQLWRCIPPSEGGLGTHGFRLGRCRHCPLVDVGREGGKSCPGRLAEQAAQDRAAGLGQLPDGRDPGLLEAPFCRGSDPPYQPDGKGVEKVALIARIHGDEAVRLGHL